MSFQTLVYSTVNDVRIHFDLYLPQSLASGSLPVIIYFHSGGLMAGSRKDVFFPEILKDLTLAKGFAFISADYRLLPTSTAYDQIHDLKVLWAYLSGDHISAHLPANTTLNLDKLAVIGTSAGTYIARLSAIHCNPAPKRLLLGYGQGGHLLSHRLLNLPPHVFPDYVTKEMVEPLLEELKTDRKPRTDLPMSLDTNGQFADPASAWIVMAWFHQQGTFLDYLTGQEGFADELRKVGPEEWAKKAIELGHKDIFPELSPEKFPPTHLFHGDKDWMTPPQDSEHTYKALKEAGIRTDFELVAEADHVLWYPGKGPTGGTKPESDDVHRRGFNFLVEGL